MSRTAGAQLNTHMGLCFSYVSPLGPLCSQELKRELFMCASVCVHVCVRTGTPVPIQVLVDTCRCIMCPYRPTLLVTFTSVYIHAYPAMQSTHTQVCCNKPIGFFFSPELPNAGSRRLAIVVTLIPRFLLQLASKWHCKFPNNWDGVLCKSPSRHQTFPSKGGGRVFRGGRVAVFDVGISSHVSVIPFFFFFNML